MSALPGLNSVLGHYTETIVSHYICIIGLSKYHDGADQLTVKRHEPKSISYHHGESIEIHNEQVQKTCVVTFKNNLTLFGKDCFIYRYNLMFPAKPKLYLENPLLLRCMMRSGK